MTHFVATKTGGIVQNTSFRDQILEVLFCPKGLLKSTCVDF